MTIRPLAGLAAVLLAVAAPSLAQTADPLREGFAAPPDEARPWVWWHWLDGNVTREGIDLDLDWMDRIGIGGFQMFDVTLRTPEVVPNRLRYMSSEWREAFRHAIGRAAELGMELGIASSPGWSETGGPWVRPEQAMKKLVWSETIVEGGRSLVGPLPAPPRAAGPFQDIARPDAPAVTDEPFYRDVAVLAFPVPEDADAAPAVRVTSSDGPIDPARLDDPHLERAAAVTLAAGDSMTPQWIRFDYARPYTVRSAVIALAGGGRFSMLPKETWLEASDDGVSFRAIAELPAGAFRQNTVSFPAVTARAFRITFGFGEDGPLWQRVDDMMAPGVVEPPFAGARGVRDIGIVRLSLLPDARISRFEEKAGFATVPDYYAVPTPPADRGSVVPVDEVIDLTDRLRPDGMLDWTPPPGRWTVLRLGASLTGQTNGPAPAESVGYEVDKLNAAHVADYMARYLATYREALGPELFGRRGVSGILNDSFEAGPQNWTDAMIAEFRRWRGYDPTLWLPALTGRVVGSAEASDRFLWDFRRTIAELLATNHYGEVARAAHAAGLTLRGEALEDHRPILGDDMAMRAHADEPMAALWSPGASGRIEPTQIADIRGAASLAHLYGRRQVGLEAFTSALQPWRGSPRNLKPIADAALALGITRFMIHSTVHQPVAGRVPGMSISFFGQYFNRNETWAEQARPWTDYLARGSYLLSQGRYVADIAYFHGEEAPLTGLYGGSEIADVPDGRGYDFVNPEALARLRVRNGWLVAPSGVRYRLLQLGGSSSRMTLATLRQIERLTAAGATVVGAEPIESPSLADDPDEFRRLADRLWSRGGVIPDRPVAEVLSSLGLSPDWEVVNGDRPALLGIHRASERVDIYFLSSRSPEPAGSEIAFRTTGRAPELWDAVTGEAFPLPYRIESDRTIVPIEFRPEGSAFIVFREPADPDGRAASRIEESQLFDLSRDWRLTFQSGRGAPAGAIEGAAGSWSESDLPGIRYFSGTGTYVRDLDLPAGALAAGRRLLLDLGNVRELAEVVVNGRNLRTLWTPPYRVDITDALRPGRNRIQLRVTNLWVNRLIGDAQPGARPITFTIAPTYRADAPLLPSGLIGPVRLIARITPP